MAAMQCATLVLSHASSISRLFGSVDPTLRLLAIPALCDSTASHTPGTRVRLGREIRRYGNYYPPLTILRLTLDVRSGAL